MTILYLCNCRYATLPNIMKAKKKPIDTKVRSGVVFLIRLFCDEKQIDAFLILSREISNCFGPHSRQQKNLG